MSQYSLKKKLSQSCHILFCHKKKCDKKMCDKCCHILCCHKKKCDKEICDKHCHILCCHKKKCDNEICDKCCHIFSCRKKIVTNAVTCFALRKEWRQLFKKIKSWMFIFLGKIIAGWNKSFRVHKSFSLASREFP